MSQTPITTIIVDDEPLSRKLIRKLIGNDNDIQLLGEYADGASAFAAINEYQPQLVMMDIQMPMMSGIQTVEKLLPLEHMPYVIFITAFDQHAIKAFELGAIDYLVKPINKERFAAALARAKTAIHRASFYELGQKLMALSGHLKQAAPAIQTIEQSLTVYKGEQLKQLKLSEVVWIEALNQYLKLHTQTDAFILSENLAQFSKKLDEQQFVRVHRSSIINLKHLCRVSKKGYGSYNLTMSSGIEIKLARSRTDLLDQLLASASE